MATQRKTTTRQSSQAGDTAVLETEDGLEEDPCGYGCHAAGVPENSVSVGCEHGTYEVTDGMRRAKPFVAPPVQNVHDQSVHFAEEAPPAGPGGAALGELLALVNGFGERLLVVEATVRQLVNVVAEGQDAVDAPPAG